MTQIPVNLVEPPGETIREELEARGWTQTDLAEIMGRPVAAVNEIINGKRGITAKTASQLGEAFGLSPQFWLNMESSYRLAQAAPVSSGADLAKLMNFAPIKEMQSRGWLPKTRDTSALSEAVKSFFRISSLDEQPNLAGAFRQSGDFGNSHVAWGLASMQKARVQTVAPFNRSRLDELKSELRFLAASSDEIRKVPAVLNAYGIRFVVVKHLRSTKTDGAALWLDPDKKTKPVVSMSLRYGRIDNFWHTLCHEISHIDHRDDAVIDLDLANAKAGYSDNEIEERANEEAVNMLIPQDELHRFILRKKPYFSAKSIIQFANKIKIHPGIIVGQLQYRSAIKYTHSQRMLVQIRDSVIESSVVDGW